MTRNIREMIFVAETYNKIIFKKKFDLRILFKLINGFEYTLSHPIIKDTTHNRFSKEFICTNSRKVSRKIKLIQSFST